MRNIKDHGLSAAYGAGAGRPFSSFYSGGFCRGSGAALQSLVFNGYGPKELVIEGLGIATFIGGALAAGHVAKLPLTGKSRFERIRADFKEITAGRALDGAIAVGVGVMLYNTDNIMSTINHQLIRQEDAAAQVQKNLPTPARSPKVVMSFGDYVPPYGPVYG
ncbi:MAG: hypothetical protein LRY54_00600 [Alphaproteobacteria bacterium]|nr:hypothetical protein [Alphaproteobacteria bacterium]